MSRCLTQVAWTGPCHCCRAGASSHCRSGSPFSASETAEDGGTRRDPLPEQCCRHLRRGSSRPTSHREGSTLTTGNDASRGSCHSRWGLLVAAAATVTEARPVPAAIRSGKSAHTSCCLHGA
eukprot:2561538-Rhodomonas_salina.1